MKLKTLKEIYKQKFKGHIKEKNKELENFYSEEMLKAEAIKWAKNYENIEDLENVVDFIEHFFNLTEDDLK